MPNHRQPRTQRSASHDIGQLPQRQTRPRCPTTTTRASHTSPHIPRPPPTGNNPRGLLGGRHQRPPGRSTPKPPQTSPHTDNLVHNNSQTTTSRTTHTKEPTDTPGHSCPHHPGTKALPPPSTPAPATTTSSTHTDNNTPRARPQPPTPARHHTTNRAHRAPTTTPYRRPGGQGTTGAEPTQTSPHTDNPVHNDN